MSDNLPNLIDEADVQILSKHKTNLQLKQYLLQQIVLIAHNQLVTNMLSSLITK